MDLINTAEKIETIVLTRSSGEFGTFVEYIPGKFRIEADGLCVLVQSGVHGWYVSFKGFEAIDSELYLAAKMALDAGQGINVTEHTNLTRDLSAPTPLEH